MSFDRALLCLATMVLASCSSLTIRYPDDGAVIQSTTTPLTVPVTVEGRPSLTGLTMQSGQTGTTDVTAQMNRTSQTQFDGRVSVVAGRNKLVATGTIPCWYCSGGATSFPVERNICVYAGPLGTPEKTASAVAPGNLSWSLANRSTVVVAPDTGAPAVRWQFLRIGGIGSSGGQIRSVDTPCLCLRSMDPAQNAPVGLAICDSTDVLQQWVALPALGKPPTQLRIQNNGRGASDACLTQNGGSGTPLVHRACQDTPEQLWTVRDNASGRIETNPF